MKYCPKCKKLYNDADINCTCADCKRKVLQTIEDETTSVYLCSGDLIERDRVQAALEDGGVPSTYTRHMVTGNSQVLTGMDLDGFDILVPYELYEKAYDIAVGVGAIRLEGEKIFDDTPEGQALEEFEEMPRAKRTTVRVLSAILFIILLSLVIFGTDYITNFIKSLFQ